MCWYRCTSLIRNSPSPWGRHRALASGWLPVQNKAHTSSHATLNSQRRRKSSSSTALICTTNRRMRGSPSTNQGFKKGEFVPLCGWREPCSALAARHKDAAEYPLSSDLEHTTTVKARFSPWLEPFLRSKFIRPFKLFDSGYGPGRGRCSPTPLRPPPSARRTAHRAPRPS